MAAPPLPVKAPPVTAAAPPVTVSLPPVAAVAPPAATTVPPDGKGEPPVCAPPVATKPPPELLLQPCERKEIEQSRAEMVNCFNIVFLSDCGTEENCLSPTHRWWLVGSLLAHQSRHFRDKPVVVKNATS
jgi:hypothetical protein